MRPEIVLLVFGMGAVTWLTRFSFLLLVGRMELPNFVVRALPFIPIGILAAFVVPGVLMPMGVLDLSPQNEFLLGAIVSAFVAARFRNTLAAMAGGMAVVVCMRKLLPFVASFFS